MSMDQAKAQVDLWTLISVNDPSIQSIDQKTGEEITEKKEEYEEFKKEYDRLCGEVYGSHRSLTDFSLSRFSRPHRSFLSDRRNTSRLLIELCSGKNR